MKIVVTGATGLLGKALVEQLTINGDSITVLTRNALKAKQVLPSNIDVFQWDPLSSPPPQESLEGSDAVVHLIGEPIQGRWTKRKKERIFRSRVTSTRNLVAAIKAMDAPPFKIVSASAVGYYGDQGDEKLTEFAGHGEGFLADVSVEWENSLSSLSDAGISITPLRLGLVLSNQGGVLKQLSFPWRLGLGVKIGAGLQWWPWIHIEDAIGLIHHALNGLMPHGPINAIAPEPVTQAEFAKELARVLHRPQIFRIPHFSYEFC